MIATLNKATKAAIPVARASKVDKEANQEQAVVMQETRDSRAEQVGAISKANRVSKVRGNRAVCLIVIARDSKAICPTVTARKANRRKLLQDRMLHLMTTTRTQNNQNTKLQTGMRIQTAA
jgi:hypothetical protein